MGANDPRDRAIFDPRGMTGRIIKEDYIHCYTQNMKALCHVVLEKIILLFFSHDPQGRGPYGPQGHG